MSTTDKLLLVLVNLLNRVCGITYYPSPWYTACCIMSLGRGIHGGVMTPAQQANIERAVQIFKSELFYFLFVSGGWSENKALPGLMTEACVMKNYALQKGIPWSSIVEDSNSMDTEASLRQLKIFMKMRRCKSAVVVADFTHYLRTKLLVWKLGMRNVTVIASHWDPEKGNLGMSFASVIMREILATVVAFTIPRFIVRKIRKLK